MFCIARFRRAKQPATAAQPAAAAAPDEPPAARFARFMAKRKMAQIVRLVTFRVGDYEVGEVFCPRLCGHPGIRY